VLNPVAQGLTNRTTGRRPAISEATVKTHLVREFGKWGVADATAAVALAVAVRVDHLAAVTRLGAMPRSQRVIML
jgi:DNA-binding NarL/FixJ family response regulator